MRRKLRMLLYRTELSVKLKRKITKQEHQIEYESTSKLTHNGVKMLKEQIQGLGKNQELLAEFLEALTNNVQAAVFHFDSFIEFPEKKQTEVETNSNEEV